MATLLRQRLAEVIAREAGGVSHRRLGAWRAEGRVPYFRRSQIIKLAKREGVTLRDEDLEGWRQVKGVAP